MSSKTYSYEICIEGQLTPGWADWFGGTMRHDEARNMTNLARFICGPGSSFWHPGQNTLS